MFALFSTGYVIHTKEREFTQHLHFRQLYLFFAFSVWVHCGGTLGLPVHLLAPWPLPATAPRITVSPTPVHSSAAAPAAVTVRVRGATKRSLLLTDNTFH